MSDDAQTIREGAYVEENERGTPILYFPDPDRADGIGYREATVAEWSFWRKYNEAQEALRKYVAAHPCPICALADREATETDDGKYGDWRDNCSGTGGNYGE